MDYSNTILILKEQKLISENDIIVLCMDAPSASAGFWGGAIGVALAMQKANHYILSANENEIRLYDINKKTGEYLQTYTPFRREDVRKISIGGLGTKVLTIKIDGGVFKFNINKKFRGCRQANELKMLIRLIKSLK